MHLLLLEDDETVGEGLWAVLRSEGHQVLWCTTLAQARAAASQPFDALVIDWNLPDGSGVEWLAGQRSRGQGVPAIVLTARDGVRDRIHGLDSGADDYLVKPFDSAELCARLRALARRAAGQSARRTFGSVEVDLTAKAVWLGGIAQELTAREWAVLEALALRAGRIVARADLEAIVCGSDAELASNAIEVNVFHLRRKLGKDFIETVRGLGYRVALPS